MFYKGINNSNNLVSDEMLTFSKMKPAEENIETVIKIVM